MLSKIIKIAEQAGKKILEIYESGDFEVSVKDDASPLTRADIASNEIITAGIKRISAYPVLSEESAAFSGEKVAAEYGERKTWERFWLVDPLDGTKDFIAKNGQFTVNIALVYGDTPVLGVIHIPVSGETYWAERGGGAYRKRCTRERGFGGGKPPGEGVAEDRSRPLAGGAGCSEGETSPLPPSIYDSKYSERIYNLSRRTDLIASDSVFHSSDKTKAFLEKNRITRIKRFGSSLKYCRLAEGEIDIYPRFNGTKEWDTAAGQVILLEAGCKIIDLTTKQNLKYNKPDIRNNFFIAMRGDLEVNYESYCISCGAGNTPASAD
jgi:3'(2'), 5'-bisphosphate nucleotidase